MNNKTKNNPKINDEFLPTHDFLNYCRTCLISIIEYADNNTLVKEAINYKSDTDQKAFETIRDNSDNNAEQWLIDNGYEDVVYAYYYKHLFFSLLVDFSNYYNASIDMAVNGNINVAWALLRRPLQETLAYIEWLYIDKNELLRLMIKGTDVRAYEIMNKQLKQKRKDHIDQIQSQRDSGKIDMFKFRYSYEDEFTLNGILQATNHLITTRPVLKTSPSGLNYVFLDDDTVHRNIGFYYTSIPYVILYAMEIIMNMFVEIAKLGDYTSFVNRLNLWLKNFCAMRITFEKAKNLFDLEEMALYCPKCGKKYSSDKAWIDFTCNYFKCKYCKKKVNTYQFIFDFENIKIVNDEAEE